MAITNLPPNQIATTQLINFYQIEFMRVEIDTFKKHLIHYTIGTYGLSLTKAPGDFVKIGLAKKIYPSLAKERNVQIRKMKGQTTNEPYLLEIDLDTKTITKGTYKRMDIKTVPPGQKVKCILNEYSITLAIPKPGQETKFKNIGTYSLTLAQGSNNVALIAELKRMYPKLQKFRNISISQKKRKSVILELDLDKLIAHTQNRENQDTQKKED